MGNGTFRESKMNAVARVATGGVLVVLGFVFLKLILGVMAVAAFILLKVVPIVLIGLVVVWLFRKLTRKDTVTTTV